MLFCIDWHFPIVFIFKTERVTAIPANPYFWPKMAEHDVTLTSLTADLSEVRNFPLVNMCRIDVGRGSRKFRSPTPFRFWAMLGNVEGGGPFRPPPPAGRGLTPPSKSRVKNEFCSGETNDLKIMKQKKDDKYLLLITQWKTVTWKSIATFFEGEPFPSRGSMQRPAPRRGQ